MAGSKTNYLSGRLLDHATGAAPYTAPTTLYLCLFSADPGELGSFANEIAGNAYARQVIGYAAQVDQETANTLDVLFPDADPGAYPDVTHMGVADALTGGNLLWHTDIEEGSVSIPAGAAFRLRAGQFTLTET